MRDQQRTLGNVKQRNREWRSLPGEDSPSQLFRKLFVQGSKQEVEAQVAKLRSGRSILDSVFGGLANSDALSGSLLDQTSVIYGTSLGNGNSHANNNLPVLIAGGGFRHAQHLALGGDHDYPLPNLFVSVLQRLGIEADAFATSTGTMRGLELVQ